MLSIRKLPKAVISEFFFLFRWKKKNGEEFALSPKVYCSCCFPFMATWRARLPSSRNTVRRNEFFFSSSWAPGLCLVIKKVEGAIERENDEANWDWRKKWSARTLYILLADGAVTQRWQWTLTSALRPLFIFCLVVNDEREFAALWR